MGQVLIENDERRAPWVLQMVVGNSCLTVQLWCEVPPWLSWVEERFGERHSLWKRHFISMGKVGGGDTPLQRVLYLAFPFILYFYPVLQGHSN